jgi:hypothetical protein
MNKAKQEAKELIFQYEYLVQTWDCYNDEPLELEFKLPKMKECAIIAVKKIIDEYQSISDLESTLIIKNKVVNVIEKLIYWQEVKQEIENYEP